MLGSAAVLAIAVATTYAHDGPTATAGHSTLEQTIVGSDPSQGFSFLELDDSGEPYFVREDLAEAKPGRASRRRSVVYLAQLTDLQLTDEESPARVEQSFDPVVAEVVTGVSGDSEEPNAEEEAGTVRYDEPSTGGASAWRPHEALIAHQVELSIRQVNRFFESPVAQGNGNHARMLNAVLTGDLADNQQRNETEWVVRLLEGGALRPNSGTRNLRAYSAFCRAEVAAGVLDPAEAPLYTGVQDFDDYFESSHIYDPENPIGIYAERGWPTYPGLMDRAQRPFFAHGLKVPSYVVFGNHDATVQGNEDANAAYERIATGCVKPVGATPNASRLSDVLDPQYLMGAAATDPENVMLVPPDGQRQFVDKSQFKAIHDTGTQADAHGFAHVDPKERRRSNGAASYYSFSPQDGLRYIVLDTVIQGGSFLQTPDPTSDSGLNATDSGNLDNPQFQWLRRELDKATRRDELTLVFGHHGTGQMFFPLEDEGGGVPPCGVRDNHHHDVNPGCDRDPRSSRPIRTGLDLVRLFHRHPNVIAYIAGHSHTNRIRPLPAKNGGGLWEIKSPSTADWPPQHRLIEVMDNRDGTLSIFGTLLDHIAPVAAPPSGTPADPLGLKALGSIGRTLTYNDPQKGPGGQAGSTGAGPEGEPNDRNVELLIDDPRD